MKVPGRGFVGVGIVLGPREHASTFMVDTKEGRRLAYDVLQGGSYHREFINEPEKSEYFVPIKWIKTVPLTSAIDEVGLFGNQNTICRPTTPKWRHTIEVLKRVMHINEFVEAL